MQRLYAVVALAFVAGLVLYYIENGGPVMAAAGLIVVLVED